MKEIECTGLVDCKNKKIYKYDIINVKGYELSSPFVVIYEDDSYWFAELLPNGEYDREDMLKLYNSKEIYKIGNMSENSDLLKNKIYE